MLHIRNSGLYKAGYGEIEKDADGTIRKWTFERYLEKRWDITPQHGRRLINGAEFVQKLEFCYKPDSTKKEPTGSNFDIKLPDAESQIRPLLTCLEHDGERLHVWQEVAESIAQQHGRRIYFKPKIIAKNLDMVDKTVFTYKYYALKIQNT